MASRIFVYSVGIDADYYFDGRSSSKAEEKRNVAGNKIHQLSISFIATEMYQQLMIRHLSPKINK